jgi:hypothetical protein
VSGEGRVLTAEALSPPTGDELAYRQTSPSLRDLLREWCELPVGEFVDLTVTVGGDEMMENPFTKRMEPRKVLHPRGPRVDLSERRRR